MSHPNIAEKPYDRAALAEYLEGLRRNRNESFRQAALRSGLDHGALLRYTKKHQRPTRESCIALADHFGVNPNEILTRAGYDPLHYTGELPQPTLQPPPALDVVAVGDLPLATLLLQHPQLRLHRTSLPLLALPLVTVPQVGQDTWMPFLRDAQLLHVGSSPFSFRISR